MSERKLSEPALQEVTGRAIQAPSRSAVQTLSNIVAVYGLLVVFILVLVIFGALKPQTFLSVSNVNSIMVSQSVTAMLALCLAITCLLPSATTARQVPA